MRRFHRQDGQAAVEFILMFPFFMVLFLFIVEFGFVLHTYISVVQAAAEGARYASVGKPPAAGACTANDGTIEGRTIGASTVTMPCNEVTVHYSVKPASRGDIVAVDVNHTYTTVTPLGEMLSFISAGTFPGTLDMGSCFDARLESGPTVQTNVTTGALC